MHAWSVHGMDGDHVRVLAVRENRVWSRETSSFPLHSVCSVNCDKLTWEKIHKRLLPLQTYFFVELSYQTHRFKCLNSRANIRTYMHCLMEYFSLLAYVPLLLIHWKDWKTLESSLTVKTSLASRAFPCVFRQKVHRFVFLQWLATWPKPSNRSSSGSCQSRLVEQQ